MKGLPCQQNCHQKVFYRGGFTFVQWGLTFLKFEQTSLFYSALYFNWGSLKLCFGGTKPTKAPSSGDGTVWQKFSLLFNAIN